MGYLEIPVKELNTGQLIDKLAIGWSMGHPGLALELVQRWGAHFMTSADIKEVKENSIYFTVNLENIHLRTMEEVRCLLISGEADGFQTLQSFWNKNSSPHHLPFILALSDSTYITAKKHFANERCLVLSASEVKQLLRTPDSRCRLKQLLLREIPRRTLIPYNILLPADGVTFFGRENELNRLAEEDFISFAIAGPGRIGKTSLVKRYRKIRLQKHNALAQNLIYISFYQSETTADGAARFLAMEIENSRRSNRITPGGLVNFLKYRKKIYGGPLDLILDEVDEVCHSNTFKFLGEAARLGFCRLILCGRGKLLKRMLSGDSPIGGRLDLIQLEPLSDEAARALILRPLSDLGFKFAEPESLVDMILDLSGRLPHHIQIFGIKLAELAISEGTDTVSMELGERLKGDLMVAQFFIKTLEDIDEPKTKLVALALLEYDNPNITIPFVQKVAKQEGLILNSKQINDICVDLTINNMLTWEKGAYRIANGGLSLFTKQTGYLNSALIEARQSVEASV